MDENQNNKQTPDNKENISLYEMLIKQQSLLLQQFEAMTKVYQRQEEKEDEIDLRKLVPKFLRRKKGETETGEGFKMPNLNIDTKELRVKATNSGFFAAIKNFFLFLWNLYVSGIKKFIYLVLFFAFLAFGFGVYVYFTANRTYSSTMIVDAGTINKNFFEGLINKLGQLSTTESYTELSRKLGIEVNQASLINNVYFDEYQDYFIITQEKTDSTELIVEYPFFTITVEIKNNSVLPVLNNSLFDYLFKNPYVNEIRDVKKQILQEEIDNLKSQLSSIDTLKYAVVKRMEKKETDNEFFVQETGVAGGGIILSQDQPLDMSPMQPFEKASDIQRAQLNAKELLLRLNTSFKIIEDFSAISDPAFPRLRHVALYTIYGLILGTIISFLLAFFLPFLKKVK